MRLSDPFLVGVDALLRPTRFAALLAGGWSNVGRAVLATLLWTGTALMLTGPIFAQWVPIGPRGLQAALVAPGLVLPFVVLGLMGGLASVSASTFWLLRPLLAITPLMSLLLALTAGTAPFMAAPGWQVLLAAVWAGALGMWLGSTTMLLLLLHHLRPWQGSIRLSLSGALLVLAGGLWWLPVAQLPGLRLLSVGMIGAAWGLVRPLSWLLAASVSLGLAWLSRRREWDQRCFAWHPVMYDELVLLPLPGLCTMLVQTCEQDVPSGGTWLLQVAEHPGQRGRAYAALQQLVRRGHAAHPVLFWLSTDPAGQTLLRSTNAQINAPPLITAYAALHQGIAPGAWPQVISSATGAWQQGASLPGGTAINNLLYLAETVLKAERWPMLLTTMTNLSPTTIHTDDPLWTAVAIVQEWLRPATWTLTTERITDWRALQQELEVPADWPTALLHAISEQVVWLLTVEEQKGAWLV